MKRRRLAILAGVVLLSVGGWFGLRSVPTTTALGSSGPTIPTARVTRGPLDRNVTTVGELRASRSTLIIAPSVGGNLRILQMAATGSAVEAGEVIIELDPAEQMYQLEQARSELAQAEQEITKRRADAAVQAATDKVELLTARFDVRRAQLDAIPDKELISANDYAKRQLSLREAERKLAQLEKDVQSRADASKAALVSLDARRAKTELAANRAQQNIDTLRISAPIDGHIAARENRDASGGIFYSGMVLPDYRAGDNTMAGRPLADLYDLTSLEIRISVSEPDRPNIEVGQSATVESHARPGARFPARVKSIGGTAQRTSVGPNRQFDAVLELVTPDPTLRPGTSVEVVLAGPRVENVLQVPVQAVRQKDGKPVVYVQTDTRFEARPINILYRTESRVGLDGLAEGTVVALVDPEASASGQKPASAAPTSAPAGMR